MNINIGGKRVEIISRPTVHADDNTLVRFVDGVNVLFASDWITMHRLPFGPISTEEIPQVKAVEAMDFEYFVCSHGKLETRADVTVTSVIVRNCGMRSPVPSPRARRWNRCKPVS
jgi:flavorubredoxin